MRRFLPALLLAAAAAPWDPVVELRPWPKGGGNPAVVFFVGTHLADPEFGTNTAFHAGGGLFVTCVHALDNYEKFEILTSTGVRGRVDRIAAWDRGKDVAVFTVTPPIPDLPALALTDRAADPGERATLCGFPGNAWREETSTIYGPWTAGPWGELVMLDVAAEAGMSGGPVVDAKGSVLGMLLRGPFDGDRICGCGPGSHAVSSREIARLLDRGRRVPGAGCTVDDWVKANADPWPTLRDGVHRSEWKKEFDAAAKAIAKRLEAKPKEARSLALLAELRRAQEDSEGAAAVVDAALAEDPRDTRALFELGRCKESRKERPSALAAYGQCADSRRPGMSLDDLIVCGDALGSRANLLHRDGRWEEAIQAYREEIALFPYHCCEHRRLGDALLIADRPREAVDPFRRALAIREGKPLLTLRLAIAESLSGDGKAALEDARRAVGLDGKSPQALFLLGYFAWKDGNREEAAAQAALLADIDPGLGRCLSYYVDGSEKRCPRFVFPLDGGLRVEPPWTR